MTKENANLLGYYMYEISQNCPSPFIIQKQPVLMGVLLILFRNSVTVLLEVMLAKGYRMLTP